MGPLSGIDLRPAAATQVGRGTQSVFNPVHPRPRVSRPESSMAHPLNLSMTMVTIVLWGVAFPFIKLALDELPPLTLAAIRFAFTSLFLLGVQLTLGGGLEAIGALTRRQWAVILALLICANLIVYGALAGLWVTYVYRSRLFPSSPEASTPRPPSARPLRPPGRPPSPGHPLSQGRRRRAVAGRLLRRGRPLRRRQRCQAPKRTPTGRA